MKSSEAASAAGRPSRRLLLLFAALVAAYCALVLTLPVFPSQDGPMHLYFSQIFFRLLTHSSPLYERYYYVRHVLPPYSLYYYLLIAISRVLPMVWADKIVVAIAVANLGFGVRALCRATGRNGGLVAFLVFPLLLNWPLFMGFVNFVLSLGLGAWTLTLWTGLQSGRVGWKRVGFVLLLCATVLTHPVPAGLVLVFCALDVAIQAVSGWRSIGAQHLRNRTWAANAVLLLCSGVAAAGYIAIFSAHNIVQQNDPLTSLLNRIHRLGTLHGLIFVGGAKPEVLVYRLVVYAALLIPLALGLRASRERESGYARLWLWLALVLIVALPFIPPALNHANFFRDRLMIVVWIAALASGSAGPALRGRSARWLVAYAAVAALLTLGVANAKLRPVARRIAELERMPNSGHGATAVMLTAAKDERQGRLLFDPYIWAQAQYLRRTGMVLLNTPWLNMTTLPVGVRSGLLEGEVPQIEMDAPVQLRGDLLRSAKLRAMVFPRADYVLLLDQTGSTPASPLDSVLASDTQDGWSCKREDWTLVCKRVPAR